GRQVNGEGFSAVDNAFSLLMHAIYDGDLEMTVYLLERVDDLSQTDQNGFTPLMAAASENHIDVARLLIARGANVNQVHRHWTALIEAADEGSLEVAELLLDNGAAININGGPRRSAIAMAASEGHLDVMKLLVDRGAHLGEGAGKVSPLHMAANEGQLEIVRYLLGQGVEVDERDEGGRTALAYAASEGQSDVVRLLIDAGADPEITDWEGRPATLYATGDDDFERVLEITQRMGDDAVERLVNTPEILVGPAGEGDLFTLQAMLEGLNMNINLADGSGNTALSVAAREGHLEIVKYLLDNGADVQGSGTTCSPLFQAARENVVDVVTLLASRGGELENGCDYRDISMSERRTISDYAGSTPLFAAIEENSPATTEALLALGADPNTEIGKTSYLIPERMDWQHVNRLETDELDSRYELRYRTRKWTPLLEAVETGERRLVRLLLENGANSDHQTEDGMTPLDLAKRLGYADIVALLNK
ncbi:MAG: ankyrin repeat domain-containing protein, partial [Lewinella sp.]